jgi:hypothetical protein
MMRAPDKAPTVIPWVTNPTETCIGRTRARVAEVMVSEPIPGRIVVPAKGQAAQVRTAAGRFVLYEKRGNIGVITAKVQNVGEVYDEIDALLDEIERDEGIRAVAIYTLNGLFALLPLRWGLAWHNGCEVERALHGKTGRYASKNETSMSYYEAARKVQKKTEKYLEEMREAMDELERMIQGCEPRCAE